MKEQYIKPYIHELRPARYHGIVYDGYYVTSNGDVYSDWKRGCEKGVRGVDYLHKLSTRRGNHGYIVVTLHRDGVINPCLVHRLVAEAFLKNPEGLPQVNHKDEDKTNNCVENLEWCTSSYNINYGTRNKRVSEALSGELNPMYGKRHTDESRRKMSIPICQYSKDGVFIREWCSGTEASETLGINRENITHCCRGRQKSAGGYIWRYKNKNI